MKCRECPDYTKCVKESNLAIKRKTCPKARIEKAKTNADRIRAMSNEKLAVIVRSVILAQNCPDDGCACDECFFKDPCFNGAKWYGKETEWLEQPAGE